jgi:hypothetical protein
MIIPIGIRMSPKTKNAGMMMYVNKPKYELLSSKKNPTTKRYAIIKKLTAAIAEPINDIKLKYERGNLTFFSG